MSVSTDAQMIECTSDEGRLIGLLDAITAILNQIDAMDPLPLQAPSQPVREALEDLHMTWARASECWAPVEAVQP